MGLNSFFHFITFFILIAAAMLAMHPYQISADMNGRKLGRAGPKIPLPLTPVGNNGETPHR
ncbi:hypothetical protein CIPAW_15G136700 [Carya illinoinensis]|uniref:Uncharacterized protein n=1 Tax=Carya illinoinensis TaxID=32201 RepID=A0A8T1ND87_CARIL|nr:hypothetical protein CIPAW_15G136700 [Carya illinoinensis]KAG6675775.1 hypothetical protein I3842_15G121100 [Carya illinoinensis]